MITGGFPPRIVIHNLHIVVKLIIGIATDVQLNRLKIKIGLEKTKNSLNFSVMATNQANW